MTWAEQLGAYLGSRLTAADAVAVERVIPMNRGASNETVGLDLAVTCEGRVSMLPLVLRPQRASGVLAPYDVERQLQVMRCLGPSAVPVPPVAWFEPDASFLGAPFYLMGRLEGRSLPLFTYGGPSPELAAVAAALAGVHAADWRGLGLDFLLPAGTDRDAPPAPIACDLDQWRRRAEHSGIGSRPELIALAHFLRAAEPPDARHALIHGDPNPGNYLIRDGRVAAVLDWELTAIGDPRADLGFYAALLTLFAGAPPNTGRTELAEAYEATTDETLHDLDFYEAAGLYKMAIIMAGWGGLGVGWGGYGFEAIARRLDVLLGARWAG